MRVQITVENSNHFARWASTLSLGRRDHRHPGGALNQPVVAREWNERMDAMDDYDAVLQANLAQVFGERDRARRRIAIAALYSADATLYEPDTVATGPDAIDEAVEALLTHLPPDFAFKALGPAIGHHGVARLRWSGGPPDGPMAVTGTDVAHISAGRIQRLYVLLDPAGA